MGVHHGLLSAGAKIEGRFHRFMSFCRPRLHYNCVGEGRGKNNYQKTLHD